MLVGRTPLVKVVGKSSGRVLTAGMICVRPALGDALDRAVLEEENVDSSGRLLNCATCWEMNRLASGPAHPSRRPHRHP